MTLKLALVSKSNLAILWQSGLEETKLHQRETAHAITASKCIMIQNHSYNEFQ